MELDKQDLPENFRINLEKFNDLQGLFVYWTLLVPDQKYLFVSPSFEDLTGYKLEEIYLNPKLWLSMIQNYETSKVNRIIKDNEIYFESTYTIKNFYGENIKVEEIIFPILDKNEQLIQLQGCTIMKNRNNSNPQIIYDIPVPFFTAEKINSQWIIKTISEKFKNLIGEEASKFEITNLDLKKFIPTINERIEELKSTGNLRLEYEFEENDNEKVFLIDLYYSVNQDGIEKIQGVFTDITDIKLNEKRLQKINSDKNKLLSIVSHDLKAPFNTILNFINLLNDGVEFDEVQQKEYLKYIYDTAKQQLELIHDLLDWAKIEAGLLEFSPDFIQLNNLIKKVLSGFSGQIYQKSIEVVQDFDKNLKVFFDKNYLKIVLSNIISNAIKFSHRNGKIIISAKEEGEFTTILIQDFGIGFSERYYRLISQSQNFNVQVGTMGEKGTGFGLKFCYDLINSNNGKLLIESKKQKGTKLIIKLRNPKVVGIYFGDEEKIKELKNYSNKIQPDGFFYLCNDMFDFLRFGEQNNVDIVFVNLDLIKNFQQSFLKKVFSEFSESSKIIGFSDYPQELNYLKSIIRIDEIVGSDKINEIIKKVFKELLQNKNLNSFSISDKYHFNTKNKIKT